MTAPLFSLGDKVKLKSEVGNWGRVVEEPRPHKDSFEYCVLINNQESWFAQSDLAPVDRAQPVWKKRSAFLCDMLLLKLNQPFSDSLYAFRASRTEFAAYQFRPVLKFLNNPDQRILIADEVGLGKTIEACMIYLELKARLDISQILVVCPSRLRQKWQDELKNRFEENFKQLNSDGLRRLLNDYERTEGTVPFRAIVGYETIRRQEFIERMLKASFKLDMVIMDEAHYMRNQDTATHRAGTVVTDSADAVVFLTATPLHLGNQDLFNLLRLLSPGEYQEWQMFSKIVQPNTHINQSVRLLAAGEVKRALTELQKVEQVQLRARFTGNPIYRSVKQRLKSGIVDREEKIRLQRDLMELNTLAQIFTRTRKREVASSAVRAAYSVVVTMTPEETLFYQTVLESVREELRDTNYGAISFAVVMKERMAASCLGALREKYENGHSSLRTTSPMHIYYEASYQDDMRADSTDYLDDDTDVPEFTYDEKLRYLAQRVGQYDSKFEKLNDILQEILAERDTKVLLFSTFRNTLSYLEDKLQQRGYSPGVIHGGVKIVDRQSVIDQFRSSPDSRILLSSEVGAEGLDFQFCGVLINYDLPWNPMQVEQRIGRLDRFGQLHERIRIYNFYLEDTIETRILHRLYSRIGIFTETVGDLEAILGEEIRKLSRKVLQSTLTNEEEQKIADEVADQIVHMRIEEDELESKADEFLGQDVILNQQVESTISSGRVIHANEVQATVQLFLKLVYERVEFTRDPEEPTWTLTVAPELTAALRKHLAENRHRSLAISERFQEAMVYNKQIALTFDSEYARKRSLLEFITYNHVLADMAISHWRQNKQGIPALRGIQVYGPDDEVGDGHFFIYAMDETGVRSRRSLMSLVVLDDGTIADVVSSRVLGDIQQRYERAKLDLSDEKLDTAQQLADRWIAEQRDQKRLRIEQQNEALISARSAALEQSYRAKIDRSYETKTKVTDDRIRRMYEGQIRNLEAELKGKLEELNKGREFSVSYSLVALGRIRVRPDQTKPASVETTVEHDVIHELESTLVSTPECSLTRG